VTLSNKNIYFLACSIFCHILPRKRHFLGPAGTKLNFNLFEQSQPNILTIRLGLKGWDPSTVTHSNLRPQGREEIWLRLVLTVQSEKRFSSLGTFGKSLRLVFSDFIQSNAVIFRTNCSTNVSVSNSENEK